MKLFLIAGARPNFMKIAPIIRAIKKHNNHNKNFPIQCKLVHTGQHYDHEMSSTFFNDLSIPEPDIHLNVGSGTHAEQTGKVMIGLEKILLKEKSNLVMVVGDVNSTLAGALTAAKLHIPVAHVEAGLRSYDRRMPEEINRLLTDSISDYLFTPTEEANKNLIKEGIPPEKIHFVGDIMIDNLFFNLKKADKSKIVEKLRLNSSYTLLTLHRPSNVDEKKKLKNIFQALNKISQKIPIVFPAHPRTKKRIEEFGLKNYLDRRIKLIEPLGFLDFLKLMKGAQFVITDSGGIQEETTVLQIPCLTLRDTTERPITITNGTNTLCGNDPKKIIKEVEKILKGKKKKIKSLEFWDGKTAERIIKILVTKPNLNKGGNGKWKKKSGN